jgi:DNA-binding GntR family transcriptional regulator
MGNKENQKLGYKSLVECVTDYLKKELFSGEINPGDEINLTELGNILGISRTPIREALIQLMKDGFIEGFSRKGFKIKRLERQEIKDIYAVGGLLESEIMKTACDKMTDSDFEAVEKILRSAETAFASKDPDAYFDLNTKFNCFLRSFCGNQVLAEFLNNIHERLYFSRRRIDLPDWEQMLLADHREMVRLMRAKDKLHLDELLRERHWNFSRNLPFILSLYHLAESKEVIK